MLKFDTCCEVAACGHVWSQLPTLLQPFFLLEALSASGSPFSGQAAHVEPFCRTQGGPFAGHASGWLRTLVFSEWGPNSASHHSDSSLPSMFCHICNSSRSSLAQHLVSSSRSIPSDRHCTGCSTSTLSILACWCCGSCPSANHPGHPLPPPVQ